MDNGLRTDKCITPIGTVFKIGNHEVFGAAWQSVRGTCNAANNKTTGNRASTQGPAHKTIGAGDYQPLLLKHC